MNQKHNPSYEAIIIGGGPAGATAALCLARRGRRVVVIEKSEFPRFHVGESFLPAGLDLVRALRLDERLERLPHVPKFGAEFGFGDGGATTLFSFDDTLSGEGAEAFNIARAPFDKMILDAARAAGADVHTGSTVDRIIRLEEGDVCVESSGKPLSARVVLDASGQATVLGRHLKLRRGMPGHRKVAYFGHFENVNRLAGEKIGHPTVAMCDEGWFWMINIDDTRTSIGLVLDADLARSIDRPASAMLYWGIERCPLVRDRLRSATPPPQTHVIADFSYHCRPYAGPGYFLVGDSAFFVDPIFSSGIALGMHAAVKAADLVDELITRLDGSCPANGRSPRTPAQLRREYLRFIDDSARPFLKLVNLFYNHNFRELFLHGQGPLSVHKAAISILAGYVFPKPAWSLRWRLQLLSFFARVQRIVPLIPRRSSFSLVNADPDPWPRRSRVIQQPDEPVMACQ